MIAPRVIALPPGTFYGWMRQAGKLGDQHKVPRVTNNRTVAEDLLRTAARQEASRAALQDVIGDRLGFSELP
jgi:hypothetical protein